MTYTVSSGTLNSYHQYDVATLFQHFCQSVTLCYYVYVNAHIVETFQTMVGPTLVFRAHSAVLQNFKANPVAEALKTRGFSTEIAVYFGNGTRTR